MDALHILLTKKGNKSHLETFILFDMDKDNPVHRVFRQKAAQELFNLRRKLENAQHEIKHWMGDCDCDEIVNP